MTPIKRERPKEKTTMWMFVLFAVSMGGDSFFHEMLFQL